MVWNEAAVARRRINRVMKTQGAINMMAFRAAKVGGKQAVKNFNSFLEELDDGD
jgi:hypothetical protein